MPYRALDWTVVDPKTIKVATGVGAARGEVTLYLDHQGLVVGMSAPSRSYAEKDGRTTRHPWRGRFWNYQSIEGRFIPLRGEVAWVFGNGRLHLSARPVQASLASAGTFAVGATLPLLLVLIVPRPALVWTVSGSSLAFLALLGSLAARAGGSPVWVSVARVTFWGALATALTAGVGALFGATL